MFFGIRPIFRVTKRRLSICVSENKLQSYKTDYR